MSDFFELLNQDTRFDIDLKELETQFIEAQKSAHPDNFLQVQSDVKDFHQKSALLNQAYTTLRDPFKRAIYYLSLQGFGLDDREPLSSDFLMEQMLVRERLEEAQTPSLKEAVYSDIRLEIDRHYQVLNTLLDGKHKDNADHRLENLRLANNLLKELRFWIAL